MKATWEDLSLEGLKRAWVKARWKCWIGEPGCDPEPCPRHGAEELCCVSCPEFFEDCNVPCKHAVEWFVCGHKCKYAHK